MIITSLLDTDLYKFTMMQVVLHHFPGANVEYRFKCRNPGIDLRPYVDEIREQVHFLCTLRFREQELAYLRDLRFIKSDFVDFLGLFQLNTKYITIRPSPQDNGEIEIVIKGPWLHTILFEIPVLAIVNEVYFRATQRAPDFVEGRRRLREKIALIARNPSHVRRTAAESAQMVRMIDAARAGWMIVAPEEAGALLAALPGATDRLRLVPLPDAPAGPTRHVYCNRSLPDAMIERLDRAIAER